jgi:SAM-dependent methyltransferase
VAPVRERFRSLLRESVRSLPATARVLDVGCGSLPPFRDVLPATWRFTGLDLAAGDVRGTAEQLPFRDGAFDAVVSFAVFEHLPEPEKSLREIARVLRPGGTLLLGTHGVYPFHPNPGDYSRWTAQGLAHLVSRSLEVEAVRPVGGVVLAFCTLLGFYLEAASGRRRLLEPLRAGVVALNAIGSRLDRRLPTVKPDGRERHGAMSVGYLVVARARGGVRPTERSRAGAASPTGGS